MSASPYDDDHWLHTDSVEEVIRGFGLAAERLRCARDDPYEWRWVITLLHLALQNLMAATCRDSIGYNTQLPNRRDKWLDTFKADQPRPAETLAGFLGLYEEIKGEAMLRTTIGAALSATPEQDRSMNRLHNLRNDFDHLVPGGLHLKVDDFPGIVQDCTDIATFLIDESHNLIIGNEEESERLRASVKECAMAAREIHSIYEADLLGIP